MEKGKKIAEKILNKVGDVLLNKNTANSLFNEKDAAAISAATKLAKAVGDGQDTARLIAEAQNMINSSSSGLSESEKLELQKIIDTYSSANIKTDSSPNVQLADHIINNSSIANKNVIGKKYNRKLSTVIFADIIATIISGLLAFISYIAIPNNLQWLKYLLIVFISIVGLSVIIYFIVNRHLAKKWPEIVISFNRNTNTLCVETKKGLKVIDIKDLIKSKKIEIVSYTNTSLIRKNVTRMYGYIVLKVKNQKPITSLRIENPSEADCQIKNLMALYNQTTSLSPNNFKRKDC